MRKIVIKKGEEKITLPSCGIYVNGYIVKATMCKKPETDVEYNITNYNSQKKEK